MDAAAATATVFAGLFEGIAKVEALGLPASANGRAR